MARHAQRSTSKARKGLTVLALSLGAFGGLTGVAAADPDFGPGNSSKGPQDPGALCHPPGQTDERPACK